MEKCSCWEKVSTMRRYPNLETIQICNGTKEREECSCDGDESKCNFYPEKRKGKEIMNTAEMWLKAQEDGKTYYWGNVKYQKNIGMVAINNEEPWPMDAWQSADYFMNGKWAPYITMTKSEAEAKFNIKIVDD